MRSLSSTLALTLTALAVAGAVPGCKKHYLPDTTVEETEANRRVISFLEDYRHAVEQRNIALLLQMAHPNYHEDGGNIDSSDDISRAGLEKYLTERFRDTKDIRYEALYRRIGEGRGGTIEVDYSYTAAYRVPSADGDVWRNAVADNRIVLVPKGESFQILSGM